MANRWGNSGNWEISSYKSWIYFVRFIPKYFILGVANVSSIVFLTLNFTYSLLSEMKVTQPCPTLCDSMDYIVHEILQARILEWVAFPFFRGSSQCRDRTQVSHVAGRFFTRGATKEAKEYWSGWPIPASAQLSYPGIKPVSPALQADSLPTELSGKPTYNQT